MSTSPKPQRTCLGCRQSVDQDQLVRYVLSPGGEVLVDYGSKLPGRGAYTHLNTECIRAAAKRQQFERAFRGIGGKVNAEALIDMLIQQIRGRIVSLLGMARKSGQIVSGSNQVLETLGDPGRVALVLLAEDVSEGIAAKVSAKAAAAGVVCRRLLDKGQIGQLTGKGERSVVAFVRGRLGEAVGIELVRYTEIVGES